MRAKPDRLDREVESWFFFFFFLSHTLSLVRRTGQGRQALSLLQYLDTLLCSVVRTGALLGAIYLVLGSWSVWKLATPLRNGRPLCPVSAFPFGQTPDLGSGLRAGTATNSAKPRLFLPHRVTHQTNSQTVSRCGRGEGMRVWTRCLKHDPNPAVRALSTIPALVPVLALGAPESMVSARCTLHLGSVELGREWVPWGQGQTGHAEATGTADDKMHQASRVLLIWNSSTHAPRELRAALPLDATLGRPPLHSTRPGPGLGGDRRLRV